MNFREDEAIKAKSHFAVSVAVSGILFLLFRSMRISLWSFIGGTLIDIDHIYDYARHPNRDPLHRINLRQFFSLCYNDGLHKVYLLLHSWELVAAVLIYGAVYPPIGTFLVPLGFGMGIHLLLDAMTNPITVVEYSFAVRLSYRFSSQKFYKRRGVSE